MNRAFLTALLAFLLLFAGLATVQAPLLALALPVFLYLLASFWRGPRQVHLRAARSLSAERILAGDEVAVTVTVTNSGEGLEEVLLEDQIPEGLEVIEGSARRLTALPAGKSTTWTYRLRGRRGYYSLSSVRAAAREFFGLVTIQETLPTDGQLFILPPVLRLRRVAIRPRRTRVYSGTIPARQGGPGVEFFDVRAYQIGDPPHWINWRASARHPLELYSNEFEQERVVDVGIILDGRRRTNEFGTRSIFEHSVLAVAALSDALLTTGNRVGLLFYGKQIHWTMPGYGKVQGERILHDLSRLEPGDSQVFDQLYVPRRLFPSHSQLILVSPLVAEDHQTLMELRLKGYHILVVSPDPVSFEVLGLPQIEPVRLAARVIRMQRDLLLSRLRAAGIQVVEWDVAQQFEQVARRELERRPNLPRGLLP